MKKAAVIHFSKLVLMLAVLAAMVSFIIKSNADDGKGLLDGKITLNLWYTDEKLTDYLGSAAVAYQDINESVRVVPTLVSAGEYLQAVHKASLENDDTPEMFIISNDMLEQAYLGGMASVIPGDSICNTDNFPQSALNAVTYKDKIVAYPFSFRTSAFLFNMSYLQEMGETSVPGNIMGIEDFADAHDAAGNLETFLNWDVSDIFYNYFFVGNYLEIGGECGDDLNKINVVNEEVIQCLKTYQELNQFFSIDASAVSYDSVISDFIQGRVMFTIASVDMVDILEAAVESGEMEYEYGFSILPGVNQELDSRTMSITDALVVNGFSSNQQLSRDFAEFLICDYSDTLYDRTGRLSSYKKVRLPLPQLEAFYRNYETSVPLSKLMDMDTFWMDLEVTFTDIWNGADVEGSLEKFTDYYSSSNLTGQ